MLAGVDWATVSSLATAGGTLVLALATFASVRSANRAARAAERSWETGLRPLLFPSRLEDPDQKIRWGDNHWAHLGGGRAIVEVVGDVIYLALSLRNTGSGNALLHAWRIDEVPRFDQTTMVRPDPEDFRRLSLDLFVPAGHVGYWEAAIRDPQDALRPQVLATVCSRAPCMVDLLYSDLEGGQRTISRFLISPSEGREGDWLCTVVRHWNLDRPDPRDLRTAP
jgi:hypothetical protein